MQGRDCRTRKRKIRHGANYTDGAESLSSTQEWRESPLP
jgi:hypothetical protein